MINNKVKIAILVVVLIAAILIIRNVSKNSSESSSQGGDTVSTEIHYDETNSVYYIADKNTGEVLHEAYSEDDLHIYEVDPDYDPKNPDEPSEYDYVEEEN